jgi:pilus assembly protein Flp/PilA
MFKKWLKSKSGQSLAEYGLVLALIAIASIAVMTTFKDKLAGLFGGIGTKVESITPR